VISWRFSVDDLVPQRGKGRADFEGTSGVGVAHWDRADALAGGIQRMDDRRPVFPRRGQADGGGDDFNQAGRAAPVAPDRGAFGILPFHTRIFDVAGGAKQDAMRLAVETVWSTTITFSSDDNYTYPLL